ncbi:hypothetical protein HanRHA438_Chr03g0110061 [Helianthus annuus]|nr:hypothetical protein HanRHA438_Chr03g0110061 [Helianthus annuus]
MFCIIICSACCRTKNGSIVHHGNTCTWKKLNGSMHPTRVHGRKWQKSKNKNYKKLGSDRIPSLVIPPLLHFYH